MFDAIAGRYDFLNGFLSAGVDRRWRRQAIAALALQGHERLLDLCTGTADLAIAARTATPAAARVVGVDFSAQMLRMGRAKLQHRQLDRTVTLVRGDATRLPMAGGSVDAVTIAFGIRNVERPTEACAEIWRVLKPRGRLVILEFAIPTSPGVRPVYLAYLTHVLPRLGGLISGHAAAYQYLPDSVSTFAQPVEFVNFLRQNGFVDVRAVSLTFGAVFLYTARRA